MYIRHFSFVYVGPKPSTNRVSTYLDVNPRKGVQLPKVVLLSKVRYDSLYN